MIFNRTFCAVIDRAYRSPSLSFIRLCEYYSGTRRKANMTNRREVLGMMGASLLARGLFAQEQELPFAALDHIECYVSNVEKSRDFFVRIFGNTLKNRGTKRSLRLGSTYMAFEPPRGNGMAGRVDHFSTSIKSLDMSKLHATLDRRAVAYQDYPS